MKKDVLELLVALQDALHFGGDTVVTLADVLRVENARRGVQRIDGGIDAELRDLS
jgi:peptide chain release factor 1